MTCLSIFRCFDFEGRQCLYVLQRRKRFEKSGLWNGGSAMLSKELSSFLGTSTIGRGNAHGSVSDPLLSPFLRNAPLSDSKVTQQDDSSDEVSVVSDSKRYPSSLVYFLIRSFAL